MLLCHSPHPHWYLESLLHCVGTSPSRWTIYIYVNGRQDRLSPCELTDSLHASWLIPCLFNLTSQFTFFRSHICKPQRSHAKTSRSGHVAFLYRSPSRSQPIPFPPAAFTSSDLKAITFIRIPSHASHKGHLSQRIYHRHSSILSASHNLHAFLLWPSSTNRGASFTLSFA